MSHPLLTTMKRILLIALCLLTVAVGCDDKGIDFKPTTGNSGQQNKPKPDDGEGTDEPTDGVVINGTTIAAKTTLCGLITDSATGKGVEGVVVSDGFTCVATDKNGVYQIVREKTNGNIVYFTVPAEYKVPVGADNHPAFWAPIVKSEKLFRKDFAIEPLAGGKESKFTLFCLADIQCRESRDVERFVAETIPDINATAADFTNPYGLTLGDITDLNKRNILISVRKAMAGQSIPFFQCMGNHDHLNEANRDIATTFWKSVENFQTYCGPQNYSFNRSDAHIVVMDNALHGETPPDGTYEYATGFYDWQFEWLKQDLSYVPKDKLVILCCHIPFRNGKGNNHPDSRYRSQVLELLSQYREAHLMIGHTHRNGYYTHSVNGKKIYEHIHGAVCGGMWHSTFNVDGTPNGYGIYEIEGNRVKNWLYKATGYDANMQMRLYNGAQRFYDPRLSVNQPVKKQIFPEYTWDLEGYVVANIWNIEHGDWAVTLWQNGKQVCNMEKISGRDWWVGYWYHEVYGTSDDGYSGQSPHLYCGKLEDPNAPFTVRAVDKYSKRKTMTGQVLTTDYSEVFGDFDTKNVN